MGRFWTDWLKRPFANRAGATQPLKRSTLLWATPLESRELPAVVLQNGFAVSSGLFVGGDDVVAGVYFGKPALIRIKGGEASPVTVLPSLSVSQNRQGSGDPSGDVPGSTHLNCLENRRFFKATTFIAWIF